MGQASLYNVLKAYALYDPVIGYCQGMSFVSALLLMYMSEEDVFWVLLSLMRGKYRLRGCYTPGFPTLLKRFYQFECLLEKYCPKLAKHFIKHDFPVVMYTTQ